MENEKQLIYVNVLVKDLELLAKNEDSFRQSVILGVVQTVKAQPTVDAVEVVRCRDCKHSTLPSLITQRYGVPGTLTCHNHNSPCNKRNVKGECFCPYGKRKDGDGNG